MRKLIWVNNVPTPYRLHLFDALRDEARRRGIEFEGVFMASKLAMRRFHEDVSTSLASYRVASGHQWLLRDTTIHFNLKLVAQLILAPPDYLVVCGWSDITSALLLLLLPLRSRRCRLLMWAEANPYSMRHKSGIIATLRRCLGHRTRAFVVPGEVAAQTICEHWKVSQPAFLKLPNLVSEQVFSNQVRERRAWRDDIRQEWGWRPEDRVLLCCARINEEEKGLQKFLEAVRDLWPPSLRLAIAGTGPDERRLREWLRLNEMRHHVRLAGHMKAQALVDLYAAADGFVLPSLRDPNPLAVVEALWAALPLMLSVRCGNWPEAVERGQNGWLFDPYKREELRAAFADMAAQDSERLRAMGRRSHEIAAMRFGTGPCVSSFFDQLEGTTNESTSVKP